VTEEEIASWRDAATAIVVPYDQHARITQQCNGFTRLRPWDFENTPADDYPLLLHHHNYMLYSSRVVKQADLVFAIYLFGDRWDQEQKARDFAFYESVTVRDSSLSAAIQGVVAAELGHLELALDYLTETSYIDLRDLAFNTRDGVHLAALSGVWHVVVAGFGGMRDYGDTLSFAPRLPPRLTRLSFGVLFRGRRLRVEVHAEHARYELVDGEPLEFLHHGERMTVTTDAPLTCPVPPAPNLPAPQSPAGRAPGLG
jgi:alpha,alpha-trehalose phosphorylase